MKPVLIVNPASANGQTGRHFDAIARAVRSVVGEFEAAFTQAVGDGVRLAREAAGAGTSLVVAVGGDGTASEVVDGLSDVRYPDHFGFIPRGTGGDLRRTLGIPADVPGAARLLADSVGRRLDLGRIEFTGHDGRPAVRHFVNVASCGISALVARNVNLSSKVLGGKLSFKLASARALLGWHDVPVRFRVDGGPWQEQPVTALAVCNGRWFGGGMMVAPEARPDDGLFNLTIWRGFGLLDFVIQQPKIYDGRHVHLSKTRVLTGREVEIEPVGTTEVLLEADGEAPGRLPARITMLPGALTVRCAA